MRLLRLSLFCGLCLTTLSVSPVYAQSSNGGWEVGAGPHVIFRETSDSTHAGGGVTVARRFEKLALVLEGSGTRRQGHNDWRAVAGPRLLFGTGARTSYFIQALAGTLVRSSDATWSVVPGVGVDVPAGDRRAIRFQLDAPIEKSDARTATSVRASLWFVF